MYTGQQLPPVLYLSGIEGIVQNAPYRCQGKQPSWADIFNTKIGRSAVWSSLCLSLIKKGKGKGKA